MIGRAAAGIETLLLKPCYTNAIALIATENVKVIFVFSHVDTYVPAAFSYKYQHIA